ncbi:MAG: hypothetical protein WCG98_06300 [bacterium]
MIRYEQATITRPIRAQVIHFLADVARLSFPPAAAKINIIPEMSNAIVTIVQMKNVAERTMSCTNNQTDVDSPVSLILLLMPSVS